MNQISGLGALSSQFISKLEAKESTIAVIGLGYVGLPLILSFNQAGHSVLGFDVNQNLVDQLKAGESRIAHIKSETVQKMVDTGRFDATTDFSQIGRADAILICVPTPLNHHREPDLSFIAETAKAIAPHLAKGQLIVLESTTYPGTTQEVLKPLLEEGSGLVGDKDFIVAFSPEREDPANPDFNTTTIPKVVGAATPEGEEMAAALYELIIKQVVRVTSPDTAEAVKLTENIFRAVNIALVNELKLIFDDMGVDVWEVIDAAATKPFGFMPFYPGPGLGGHCIPIDPFYLTWKAREYGHHTRFIELAGEINMAMPAHVVSRLGEALSERQKKALNGSKVLVVGIAYKKNVDDMRESPSLTIIELLQEKGAEVDYHDPHIPEIISTREHIQLAGMKSVDWSPEKLASYDAVLICTNHDCIDWSALGEHAKLVVDSRNAMKGVNGAAKEKVIKA
jgi:UDP-N-acetyl-D-glucosamine dehydrogenase